ncbi:TolC family protein [Emcibacter sp.]|uniref:TolC family protein n=1 Tax=Emcibacter sp. TaxID=1979954 RepID=UPI002AA5ECED|nr:TolC family protein [Emcibacter sp.]
MQFSKTIIRTTLAGLFLLFPGHLLAEEHGGEHGGKHGEEHKGAHITLTQDATLSMGEVVGLTAERAPERYMVEARTRTGKAYRRKASSFFSDSPQISVHHQNDFLMSDQGLREWEGRLDLPIWMPGEKRAWQNRARAAGSEADAYRDRLVWEVAGEVRELLWQVKLTEAALQDNRAALETAEKLLDDVERRIKAGDLPKNSVILARQELAARRIALKGAERDYVDSAMTYQTITGLASIPASVEEQQQEVEDDYAVPPVTHARRQLEYYQAEYDSARASWSSSPTVTFGVKRERGGYDDRSIDSVSLGLAIPLGSATHSAPRRAEAAEKLAVAERQLALAMRDQKLALHEAEHELEVCLVQMEITEEHFAMATENLRLARRAFELGESDLMDLLRVQDQYFQSSGTHSLQKLQCGLAVARHNQTKGIFPQ